MFAIPSFGTICYLIAGGVVAGILASAASFASLASYPLLLSVWGATSIIQRYK